MYDSVARRRAQGNPLKRFIGVTVLATWCQAAYPQHTAGPDPLAQMSDALRSSLEKVVVIAGQAPTTQEVSGTYEQEQAGLIGGMNDGARIGTVSKDIGGVPINFPIPILSNIGMVYGGLTGAAKEKIQDFRDAMADELAQTGKHPLTNEGVALDVFWSLQDLPGLDSRLFAPSTPIPEDADAILYVGIEGLQIDVQGGDAILTTYASASLRRHSDGSSLYETVIRYQDQDELDNWIENDKALWRAYANYARHYLGRELSADLFKRVQLEQRLEPVPSDDAKKDRKNKGHLATDTLTPTLAWALSMEGDTTHPAWVSTLDESQITYDFEIYDARQLVYAEEQVPDPEHALLMELPSCQLYYWSVRPVYHVDGRVYYGEWMKSADPGPDPEFGKGIRGRQASVAPAYVQDFPQLRVNCRRR